MKELLNFLTILHSIASKLQQQDKPTKKITLQLTPKTLSVIKKRALRAIYRNSAGSYKKATNNYITNNKIKKNRIGCAPQHNTEAAINNVKFDILSLVPISEGRTKRLESESSSCAVKAA